DGAKWARLGSLKPVPLPGGDSAVLDIWKMGLSWLLSCGEFPGTHAKLFSGISRQELSVTGKMCATGVNSPACSSMGRLFDAVAFFAGLGRSVSYEAQAAMELEALYRSGAAQDGYGFEICRQGSLLLADPTPLIKAALADGRPARISAGFHTAVAKMTVDMLLKLSKQTGVKKAALSGGVFQNKVLLELVWAGLERVGITPFTNKLVPANDGGLSLGQCWAARKVLG
ncbi:MAG TPA: hypothetical protein PLL10_11215, partial [Elusimicrobiales bacterium]|nr:hypothetical protein [Elusimicrobiales bacterium]